MLSWSVSGATSIVIDGIGDLSRYVSTPVWPTRTTTYKLIATNIAGSATATVTVTVNSPASDTAAPTQPSPVAAAAQGATEVLLTWGASTDNVGVAGYEITRNGSLLVNVPATTLAYNDKNVTAATAYTYMVKAYDAASNYSSATAAQVATPAVPPSPPAPSPGSSGPCPSPAVNAFTVCYYSNTELSGSPAVITRDAQINFGSYNGFPAAPLSPSNYSVRWQGKFSFQSALYVFQLTTSDGMRLYVDGNLVFDRWRDQATVMYNIRVPLTQGEHLVTVEHYGKTGTPTAQVSWFSLF